MTKRILISFATTLWVSCSIAQYSTEVAFPSLTFSRPVALVSPPDGSSNLFVLEQAGFVKVFENSPATTSSPVFLDLQAKVDDAGNEQGLLGLAFHPDYATNGYFYVNYTAADPGRTVVSRFTVNSSNPLIAEAESESIVIEIPQTGSAHNGGTVLFGPDGMLYISLGDGGGVGDPLNHAQRPETLLGNILRIDIDGSEGANNYRIPADNPFVGNSQGYREEVFAYGFRNPWKFSIDPLDGRLWAADVGQWDWEEIDVVEPGRNYGWVVMEGAHCYLGATCDPTGLELPVWEYPHTDGNASITGGFVYRGSLLPGLAGKYVYADYVSGRIWALRNPGSGYVNELVIDTDLQIPSFGSDQDGELYFLAFDGKIHRIVDGGSTNQAPSFTSVPVTGATEDQPYTYSITATDNDGDDLTFSAATPLPAWLTLTNSGKGTATLSGTPANADVGPNSVDLEVTDGTLTDTQSFTITVANLNDPPVFTSTPVTVATEDQLYSYNITTSDPDGPALTITAPTRPAWLTLNDNGNGTATLSGTPDNGDVGPHPVTLNVSDGLDSAPQSFTVTVSNTNDPPTITSTPVTTGTQDALYTHDLTATDPDGNALAYTAPTLPSWLTLTDNGDGTARLSGTPGNADVGANPVTIRVSDGGLFDEQSFTITVADVNDAPSFTSTPVTTSTQDVLYSYAVTTADPDGDARTITATQKPTWLTLTDNGNGTATLSGTPGNDEVGVHAVTLTVSDGTLSDQQSFTVTVSATLNHPPSEPSIVAPADGASIMIEGDPLATVNVTWSASTDADGDPVTYTWVLADNLALNPDLLRIEAGTTLSLDIPVGQIAATLSDAGVGVGESMALYHAISVSDGNSTVAGPVASITAVRGLVTSDETPDAVPTTLVLHQNYPNPFSRTTRITIELPTPTDVSLRVFDILGRVVETLFEGSLPGGRVEVGFHARDLPAGIYTYRLEAQDKTLSRVMTIID